MPERDKLRLVVELGAMAVDMIYKMLPMIIDKLSSVWYTIMAYAFLPLFTPKTKADGRRLMERVEVTHHHRICRFETAGVKGFCRIWER